MKKVYCRDCRFYGTFSELPGDYCNYGMRYIRDTRDFRGYMGILVPDRGYNPGKQNSENNCQFYANKWIAATIVIALIPIIYVVLTWVLSLLH